MADRKLEGPGSSERLTSVQRGFQRASRRLGWRSRFQGWAGLGRVFAIWFIGLLLFALVAMLMADWLA